MKFRTLKTVRFDNHTDKYLRRAIRNIFGFRPGNIFLYRLAFTHKSASQETIKNLRINNERLEFLGDAILDAVAADFLFKTFPAKDEGFLTEMRSKLVSRAQLNKLSQKMGVDNLIQLENSNTGMFRSFKGDAFEALIGAIYLDKGFNFTRKIILKRVIGHYIDMDDLVNQEVNFKSKVIEWAQKEKKQASYNVLEEIGTGYKKQYLVELVVEGQPIARGQDYSIKGAEQNASEKAWQKINGDSL
ncbi:MAG: ribonuclease III [Bacteroidetes bacterium]|nr:ribonuclease III [Bacteroidota bacterium]